jgi:hypothetical protein
MKIVYIVVPYSYVTNLLIRKQMSHDETRYHSHANTLYLSSETFDWWKQFNNSLNRSKSFDLAGTYEDIMNASIQVTTPAISWVFCSV